MTVVTIDAIELVLRVLSKGEGGSEVPPGSNAGPFVEPIQKVTGNKRGDAWCASNVADAGVKALGKAWPLPLTGGCQALGDFAQAKGILVAVPQRGDVWLKYEPKLKRFGHTGFVRSVSPDQLHIEVTAGNTIRPGQSGDTREGWLQWTRLEAIGPDDRFVRWITLLPPELAL